MFSQVLDQVMVWTLLAKQTLYMICPGGVMCALYFTFIQNAWIITCKIYSKGCLVKTRMKLSMFSKLDRLIVFGWLHPITLGIDLVIGWLIWETSSKHLDVYFFPFSAMTTVDAILVQKFGTLHHPGTGVAAVGYYVEIATFEELLVKTINILKLQASIFEYPVTSFPFSMSSVPNEDCRKWNEISAWTNWSLSHSIIIPSTYKYMQR